MAVDVKYNKGRDGTVMNKEYMLGASTEMGQKANEFKSNMNSKGNYKLSRKNRSSYKMGM